MSIMTKLGSNTTVSLHAESPGIWTTVKAVVAVSIVATVAFCWAIMSGFLLAVDSFKRVFSSTTQTPTLFYLAAFGIALGITIPWMLALSLSVVGRSKGKLVAAMAGVITSLFVIGLYRMQLPWLIPLSHLPRTLYHLPIYIWAVVVAILLSICTYQWSMRWSEALRGGDLKIHLWILGAAWMIGGFVAYTGGSQEMLIALGALIFLGYTYPRLSHHPQLRVMKLSLVVAALGYIYWMVLRDVPIIWIGERACGGPDEIWKGGVNFRDSQGLTVLGGITLNFLLALCLIIFYSQLSESRPSYRNALRGGGALLLLLIPTLFLRRSFQELQMITVTALYAYLLFANGVALRPFLKGVVITCSWVPIVGIGQCIYHYWFHSRAMGIPFWRYQVGSDDPFMWHDCYGQALVVLLAITYGLIRTSGTWKEKRVLTFLGGLFCIALVLSFARGAWFAFIGIVAIGSVWIGGRQKWYIPTTLVLIAILILCAAMAGWIDPRMFLHREIQNQEHLQFTKLAVQVFLAHPLFGVAPWYWDQQVIEHGLRTYGPGVPLHGILRFPVEGGVVGIIAFLCLLLLFMRRVFHFLSSVENPHQRVLIHTLVLALLAILLEDFFSIPFVEEGGVPFGIMVGAVLGISYQHKKMKRNELSIPSQQPVYHIANG